jgi:PKD repeat protein
MSCLTIKEGVRMRKTCLAVVAVLLVSSLGQIALGSAPEGPAGARAAPTAVISEPRNGGTFLVGTPVSFVGSNSTDPDGDRLLFKWGFGDGEASEWGFNPNATHTYLGPGVRIVNLTVNDTQESDRATVVINIVPLPNPNNLNVPPKAASDGNKTAYTEEMVYFTSLATDSNGDNLTYKWDFGEDRIVNILQPDAEGKTVTHIYNVSGNFTVTHWVQETNTTERYVSAPSTVWANITGLPVLPPLADAGPNVNGVVNVEVTLNGAGASQNAGGKITKFEWDFENDGTFDWSSNTTGKAKHTYTAVRTYIARLKVTDDRGGTAEDITNVTITAPPNKLPVANAGDDKSAYVGQAVSLQGTASDEDGQVVKYQWDYEDDGVWDYESPSSGMGSWAYSSPGTFEARFRVTDDRGGTAEDTATVTVVQNLPPIADAGGDQSVNAGDMVQFDGSGSRDPEGGRLTFSWDFDDRDGLQPEASGPMADHTYTKGGEYTATLTVKDDMGQVSKDTAIITVTQAAGVSMAANPRTKSLRPDEEGVFTVTVQNTGNGRDSFELLVSGDNYRWATLDSAAVSLDAGASTTVTMRVTPPLDAAAGAQAKLTVRAVSGYDQNVQGQVLVTVTALQRYATLLSTLNSRMSVEAGKSASFTLQVTNGGNGDDTVRLSASGAAGKWAAFSAAQAVVTKGTTKTVTVKLTVPSDAAAQDYLLTLVALSGDNTTQSQVSLTLSVKAGPAPAFIPGLEAAGVLGAFVAACAVAAVFRRRRSP